MIARVSAADFGGFRTFVAAFGTPLILASARSSATREFAEGGSYTCRRLDCSHVSFGAIRIRRRSSEVTLAREVISSDAKLRETRQRASGFAAAVRSAISAWS